MQKDSKSQYMTILRTSNKIDNDYVNNSNTSFESDNFGLYGLVGKIPKYSKPFSQAYLQKIQSDYQNWINSRQVEEYHEMMKEAELREKKSKSSSELSNQKAESCLLSHECNQNTSEKFDPCKARHILSKSLNIKGANYNINKNENSNITIEDKKSLSSDAIAKLHCNKQFHVGCVKRSNDGTFKTFDQSVTNWREKQEIKLSKKILRYDELDLQNKKKKAHLLHSEMTNFLNNKRSERLQLGLACQQQWAILKASASAKQIQEENQRPITASSKEAMDELEQFEQRQKQIRKEMKANINKNDKLESNNQNSSNNEMNDELNSNKDYLNEDDAEPFSYQSFKLTQLPPGSAIVG